MIKEPKVTLTYNFENSPNKSKIINSAGDLLRAIEELRTYLKDLPLLSGSRRGGCFRFTIKGRSQHEYSSGQWLQHPHECEDAVGEVVFMLGIFFDREGFYKQMAIEDHTQDAKGSLSKIGAKVCELHTCLSSIQSGEPLNYETRRRLNRRLSTIIKLVSSAEKPLEVLAA